MSGLTRARLLIVGEGRFVNEQVCAFRDLNGGSCRARVSGEHHLSSRTRRPHELRRFDDATIIEWDRLSLVNSAPRRTLGNPECARLVGIESSEPDVFHESVS